MNFKPFGPWVLVARDEKENKSSGGILIPDSVKEKGGSRATVVAVGQGEIVNGQRVPFTVKPGDKILYVTGTGTEPKNIGPDYLLLKEAMILGVFE
jgi:chaperonin GroES